MRLQINKQKIRRLYYHFSRNYLTLNNLVVAAAFVIGLSWVWGSISVMERNYALQKQIDNLKQQQKLSELQLDLLKYQQQYFNTDEYKELSARQHLGLAGPGEKLLVLPPNSQQAIDADARIELGNPQRSTTKTQATPPSNLEQWMTFLFGGASRSLNSNQ